MILIRNIVAPAATSCIRKHLAHCSTKASRNVLAVVTEQINPLSKIRIQNCDYNIRIKPNDILDPSDVNSLRAILHSADGESVKGAVNIQVEGDSVTIQGNGTGGDGITCQLEVPVKSDLNITATRSVHIEKMYSDDIKVLTSCGDITTRNLQGFRLEFETHRGNVHCDGNTLANQIFIRTRGNGNILLNKIQGDLMYAICDSGSITTNSCYAEASKFVSLNGRLFLRNVHKFAEMYLLEAGGELDISGFHGTLQAKTNGGKLRFQLTEVYGDSCIVAMNRPEELILNMSEFVLENTELEMVAEEVLLDDSVEYLSDALLEKGIFRLEHPNLEGSDDKLSVSSDGTVRLGKMSWADTIRLKINLKKENQEEFITCNLVGFRNKSSYA